MRTNTVLTPLVAALALACKAQPPQQEANGVKSIIGESDDVEEVEAFLAASAGADRPDAAPAAAAGGLTLADVANAVAVLGESDTGDGYCTGWLVAPQYVVTNQHCVAENATDDLTATRPYDQYQTNLCGTGGALRIRFDHQRATGAPGYQRPSNTVYRCKRMVVASFAYDLAIIELDRAAPETHKPLRVAASYAPGGQSAFIVGHPGGTPKKISYRNRTGTTYAPCIAYPSRYPGPPDGSDDPHPHHVRKNANQFNHSCDTIGGNSGSAVLDATTLEVIGLHWSGWKFCKWPHYHPGGPVAVTSPAPINSTAAQTARSDALPYREGNVAIEIRKIAAFLHGRPTGNEVGAIPEAVKAVFPR
jgi:hypothetical protein